MSTPTSRRQWLMGAVGASAAIFASCSPRQSVRRPTPTSTPGAAPTSAGEASTTISAPTTVAAADQFNPITPYITPNKKFYKIDNAIEAPVIDPTTWSMSIEGMVDKPLTLSYAQLLAREQIERTVTLSCVSNEVGGHLVGNAVWEGVRLADLLREAGVKPEAQQVFGTSVDGFTCGFPVSVALDGRDALIALRMNGEPLPADHGFPARVVVPGLYGYVSATKWLKTIKLTTWDDVGYWVPLGWNRDAPIKTECRIDLPKSGEKVPLGPTFIAGVAWAPHAGIKRVEVQIDKGPWLEATMGDENLDDAWRMWRLSWTPTPGSHLVRARATDKSGVTQTEESATPAPDGATGYPTRGFTVA